MADDFKALVALTKETNAKLELLHRQGDKESSPRERILDATPEILSMERIMNKEKAQRAKLHKEDQINRNKGEKETVQAVKETSKETSKPIVEVVKEDIKFSSIFNKNLLTSIDSGNMKLIGSSVLGSEKIALSLNGFTNSFEPYLESGLKESKEGMKFFKNFLKPTGAEAAEDEKKKERRQELFNKGLKGLGDGIKSLASKGFDKIKSGLSGLAKFALGGLALAALAFLNDPKFVKMASTFIDDIIPKIAFVLDEYIIPFGKMVGGRLLNLFKNIHKTFTDPNYGIFDLLNDNILELGILTGLIAPSLFTVPLRLAFSGLFGALKILPSTLTKLFAGGAVAGGLFNIGKDFYDEFDKTGSVSKSFAAALAGEGEGGIMGALGNLGKFGLIGFGAGMFFTPLGAVIGGLAGTFIDLALGALGKDAVGGHIDKAMKRLTEIKNKLIDSFMDFITSTLLTLKGVVTDLDSEDTEKLNKANKNREVSVLKNTMNRAKSMMNRKFIRPEELKKQTARFNKAQLRLNQIEGKTPDQLAAEKIQEEVERSIFIRMKAGEAETMAKRLQLQQINSNNIRGGDTTNNSSTSNVSVENSNYIVQQLAVG